MKGARHKRIHTKWLNLSEVQNRQKLSHGARKSFFGKHWGGGSCRKRLRYKFLRFWQYSISWFWCNYQRIFTCDNLLICTLTVCACLYIYYTSIKNFKTKKKKTWVRLNLKFSLLRTGQLLNSLFSSFRC